MTNTAMTKTRISPQDVDRLDKARRIGEVAQAVGVTTRTLRYWQEIALIAPTGGHDGSERLYTKQDLDRALHIKELQSLLGFTLSEIGMILNAEDSIATIKNAYHPTDSIEQRRELRQAALRTMVDLVEQIDDKLARIQGYRDELAVKAERMRTKLNED